MEKDRREKPAIEFFANATIKKPIKMRRENIFRRNYQMTSIFVKPIFIVLIIIFVDLIELRFGIFTLRYFLMHQLTSTEQHLFYYLHTSIDDQRSNFVCDFLSKHIRLIENFFFSFLFFLLLFKNDSNSSFSSPLRFVRNVFLIDSEQKRKRTRSI